MGCVAANVYPALASAALEQILAPDIISGARGMPLVYRYLRALAVCALVGGVLGLIMASVGINHSFAYSTVVKGYASS